MNVRENSFLEASRYLMNSRINREETRNKLIQESVNKRDKFVKKYHDIKESRLSRERAHSELLEAARNSNFSTVLKSIYITALEANTLTDNGIILAENMVDSWIREKGGALSIFNECKNDTYLLSRLHQIVEDAAQDDVKAVEDLDLSDKNKSDKESKDDKKDDSKQEKEDNKESEKDKEKEEPKKEKEENKESEKDIEGTDEEETDDKVNNDSLNITDIDDKPEESDDNTETDTAEDIIDDIEPDNTPVSVDGDGAENKGKIFEELEKEEDVKKAIELIKQRVADAEESFIKRNAEDKKQIDELLSKISDNVKTVEDLSEEEPEKSKVAEESARNYNRRIKAITENRPLTVLEKMTRNLSSSIIKDSSIREQYLTENGDLDTYLVIESAKVMYGFLETLSTLKLEKVDSSYIAKVLEEM